jgi:D-alanine-D-alanine ligase
VGITSDGGYVLAEDNPDAFALDADAMPRVTDNGTTVRWPERVGNRTITVVENGVERSLGQVDVVFPILHGPFGEDGTVQGMLELIGLPYVGSGVLASALGMDKHYTKTVLLQAGIDVAPWVTISELGWRSDPLAAASSVEKLGLPLFVKPARAGSSVGVSKVKDIADLAAAIEVALAEDNRVLVESTIVGREVECAVLEGRPGEPTRVSVAGEIVMTEREFYDFDAKYLNAPGIELVCPANLTPEQLESMQSIAARSFEAIGGSGLARVDFFLTETGFVVNEVNTMPGFTPISMFPTCWIESGVSYPELIDELLTLALLPSRR